MKNVSDLIIEMQAVKSKHPTLEITDILSMFNIIALNNLTREIYKLRGVRR